MIGGGWTRRREELSKGKRKGKKLVYYTNEQAKTLVRNSCQCVLIYFFYKRHISKTIYVKFQHHFSAPARCAVSHLSIRPQLMKFQSKKRRFWKNG